MSALSIAILVLADVLSDAFDLTLFPCGLPPPWCLVDAGRALRLGNVDALTELIAQELFRSQPRRLPSPRRTSRYASSRK